MGGIGGDGGAAKMHTWFFAVCGSLFSVCRVPTALQKNGGGELWVVRR